MHQIRRYAILLVCAFFLAIPKGWATHLVGGELTYKEMPNDDFEVSLTIYRDCFNGIPFFQNPAVISAYDSNDSLITTLSIPLGTIININNPPIYLDQCLYKLPQICYHYTTYTGVINLPPIPGGYTLSYDECCWNQTITNINFTSNLVIKTEITDSTLNGVNDSPIFTNLPPNIICQGVPFSFDHSATDADGDSLSYELFTPLSGGPPPFVNIVYKPGYDIDSLTRSVDEMKIDPVSGLLTVTIDSLGQYVYGVRVREYRNGVNIGSTWRSYQINAASCESFTIADFEPILDSCTENQIVFQNTSKNGATFQWDFGDGGGTNLRHPAHIYADTGTYTVTLIAKAGTRICSDTIQKDVFLSPDFFGLPVVSDFDVTEIYCIKDVQFTNKSQFAGSYEWDFGDALGYSSAANTNYIYLDTGTYWVTLIAITDEKNCRDTSRKKVVVRERIELDPSFQDFPCSNELWFKSNIGADTLVDYNLIWSFNGSDTSHLENPIYQFEDVGTHTIQLIANFKEENVGCNDTAFIEYSSKSTEIPNYEVSTKLIQIFQSSDSITLHVDPDNYVKYSWSPAELVDDWTSAHPKAKPDETTTYVVSVVSASGCEKTDSITVYVYPLRCGESETFVPNAFTPNNDGENDFLRVRGGDLEELYLAIYNRWGELVFESTDVNMINDPSRGWDGTYKGKNVEPGVFVYYMKAVCYGNTELIKKGNISLIR